MEIIEPSSFKTRFADACALTIGNFDGVHLGHQKIIARTRIAARGTGVNVLAVMTFEPHPAAILHPQRAPQVITPLPLKKHLLQELGVDCMLVLTDSFDLLNLSPADFVDEFLMKRIGPKVIVEGPNFNFGYGRSGDAGTLKQLGAQRGFDVVIMPAEEFSFANGEKSVCSSSLVRRLLEKGQVANAAVAMGRPYRLMGPTIAGRGVGKRLGFATANIEPVEQIIPAEGVYAGFVATGSTLEDVCRSPERRDVAISIGRAKTFVSGHPLLVEAHILEENVEDLTGKWLAMSFVKYIRTQQRFETKEQLAAQIAKDCEAAKQILAE